MAPPWTQWERPLEMQLYSWGFAPMLWIYTSAGTGWAGWKAGLVRFRVQNSTAIGYYCTLRPAGGDGSAALYLWGGDAMRLAHPAGPELGPLLLYPADSPSSTPSRPVPPNR